MNLLDQDSDQNQEERIRSLFLPQKNSHVNVAKTSSVKLPTEYGLSTQKVTASNQRVKLSAQESAIHTESATLKNQIVPNNGTISLDILSVRPEDSEINSGWMDKFLS